MAQRKIALVIGYGQSNESGHACKFGDATSGTNPLSKAPLFSFNSNIRASSGSGNVSVGMFSYLAEMIAKRDGHTVELHNFGVDGSGAITQWTGFTGSVTTGTPNRYKNGSPDAGYDPSGNIGFVATMIGTLSARGYEVWSIQQGGQADSGVWTATQESNALADMFAQFSNAGASKLIYGTTPITGGGANAAWAAGGFFQLVRSGVATAMVGNPKFLLGADLSNLNGTGIGTNPDANMSGSSDQVHANNIGCKWAAKMWYASLKSASLI